MKLSRRSSPAEVALAVSRVLSDAGIQCVLTGGACASIYTRGSYQSADLDFVLQSAVSRARLDAAMAAAGFVRHGDRYVHPRSCFFVEFPAGPLGIGGDLRIQPVVYRRRGSWLNLLSPTDSCRDRLAAFYHWNDRQSLRTAVQIALRHRLDLDRIRTWSIGEGAAAGFAEFVAELGRERSRRRRPRE